MPRLIHAFFFTLLLLCCTGMGGTNNDILTSIPTPDREFQVQVSSVDGLSYTVTSFSVDGVTALPVSLGKIEMGIDFADIASMTLVLDEDKEIQATVVYTSGQKRKSA